MPDNTLRRRVLEICYRNRTSHVGSCLSAVGIIDDVYARKSPEDIFVLSCGHAGIALYAVLEKYSGYDAQSLYEQHGVHPSVDPAHGIACSSGSLGCGLSIACGIALVEPRRRVFCLVSDGECAEGLVWETLQFADGRALGNLALLVNANGYGATTVIQPNRLERRLRAFHRNVAVYQTAASIPGVCEGLEAHYHVLTEEEYATALRAIGP